MWVVAILSKCHVNIAFEYFDAGLPLVRQVTRGLENCQYHVCFDSHANLYIHNALDISWRITIEYAFHLAWIVIALFKPATEELRRANNVL
jgi:hypothetical protein